MSDDHNPPQKNEKLSTKANAFSIEALMGNFQKRENKNEDDKSSCEMMSKNEGKSQTFKQYYKQW